MPVTNPAQGALIVIHAVGGKRAEFKERRIGVDDRVDPLANEHLPALFVPFDGGGAAAFFNRFELGSKFGDQFFHGRAVGLRFGLR
jgi:hypothetical protein